MATMNHADFPGTAMGQRNLRRQQSRLALWVRQIPHEWWPSLLLVSDALLVLCAFASAYYVRYEMQLGRLVDPANRVGMVAYVPFAALLVIVSLLSYRFSGIYPYQAGRSLVEETYTIGTATTLAVVILSGINLIYEPLAYSRLLFLYTAIFITLYLGVSRLIILQMRRHLRGYGIGVRRVLLVGAGDVGRMVMRTMVARPELGYQVAGFLDDNPIRGQTNIGPYRALGPILNFHQVIAQETIDNVIICLPWHSHELIQQVIQTCEQNQIRAQLVPDYFHFTKNQVQVDDLNGIPLLSTRDLSIQGWNYIVKRSADIFLSVVAVLLGWPLMVGIALAIRFDSAGPVIYKQERVGKNGKTFACYKFRSMVVDADARRHEIAQLNESTGPLFKMRNDPRLTRVGRFIRRFSLDEIPQLYNVFRGEMSIVGPRPNLPAEVEEYEEWHKKRLAASPGITGLWQVSGRSDLTFDEMVLLDIYYVENWSLALDLHILLRSIPAVLGARGAY
ncbi:MAG: sugar transferase [Caldilineaceae bacterium]|nr:sugar transferase [Caldilineaceae bacterium]